MPDWRSLIVDIEAVAADALSEALLAQGALAASIEDAFAGTPRERPLGDEPGGAGPNGWTRTRIRALLPAAADPGAVLDAAARQAGLAAAPPFALEPLADRDWVRHTQSQFEPLRISARLWIVPSWHAPPDPTAINLALDPGLAFGTGSHPTTRLCLRWLEQRIFAGAQVLDYGCGSGILAIAAMKLGAGEAVGVDLDPAAIATARENSARNGVAVRWVDTEAPLECRADLVMANIVANPLKLLAPLLAAHCRPGGRLVLAGILAAQTEELAAFYAPWFDMTPAGLDEGWVALDGVRR